MITTTDASIQEDASIAQIDLAMRALVFASEEEERGYLFSRYREPMATA